MVLFGEERINHTLFGLLRSQSQQVIRKVLWEIVVDKCADVGHIEVLGVASGDEHVGYALVKLILLLLLVFCIVFMVQHLRVYLPIGQFLVDGLAPESGVAEDHHLGLLAELLYEFGQVLDLVLLAHHLDVLLHLLVDGDLLLAYLNPHRPALPAHVPDQILDAVRLSLCKNHSLLFGV